MKRALKLTLTLALVGSLMAMGFAGTAAAADITNNAEVDQATTATTDQAQESAQEGEQNQEQAAEQSNELEQGDNFAATLDGNVLAGNAAAQQNNLDQEQDAEIDQESEQDQDAETDAESESDVEFELEEFINLGF